MKSSIFKVQFAHQYFKEFHSLFIITTYQSELPSNYFASDDWKIEKIEVRQNISKSQLKLNHCLRARDRLNGRIVNRAYELSNMSRGFYSVASICRESVKGSWKRRKKRPGSLRLIQARLADRIKPIRLPPLKSRIRFPFFFFLCTVLIHPS